ncbi:MAG: 3-hydroxyacyl-CoA dehydrogenase family protein [Ferruginibacter sp.]
MKVLVLANDISWNELIQGSTGIEWMRAENTGSFTYMDGIDAYFDLLENPTVTDHSLLKKTVFIGSVDVTLQKINAAGNVVRINSWNGFLKRKSWEVAGIISSECLAVLKAMNKNVIPVPDEPGFIAARVISMIINEAYFAKAENVSTEKEIDIAMKLGTNYPYGPFEWAGIIGIKKIYALLHILSKTDPRYKPSPLLEQEAMKSQ